MISPNYFRLSKIKLFAINCKFNSSPIAISYFSQLFKLIKDFFFKFECKKSLLLIESIREEIVETLSSTLILLSSFPFTQLFSLLLIKSFELKIWKDLL